jgi:hypothetical protein
MRRARSSDDLDAFWKDALDTFLEPFMALLVPELHQKIDWTAPVIALDKEFQAVVPRGRAGRRFVDKLFQVTMKSGTPVEILIHVEVTVTPDPALPWRMFEYRFLIARKRRLPVISIAVLADDDPRHRADRYRETGFGSSLLFRYRTIKLLDFAPRIRALQRLSNPFALLLVVWLRARATDPGRRRLHFKRQLFRTLRRKGFDGELAREVFRLLDWLIPPSFILIPSSM